MSESPFKKKQVEFKREPTAYESARETVMSKLHTIFLNYLPSEEIKAMSPEYLYPIGAIAIIALICIFLAIFLNGYYSSIHNQYLAPTTGTSASKLCVAIPTINTGNYLATQSGIWQGADGFQFGNAAYLFTVTSLSLTYKEYADMMTEAYNSLQIVNLQAVNYDLAKNLVYWMSGVTIPFPENAAQRLSFTGTPLSVFNRQKVVATMANILGSCNATSVASFDTATAQLTLIYNYEDYVSNAACMAIIDPAIMGYFAPTDKNEFKLTFDVRTLITAVAINMGVLGVNELVQIPAFDTTYKFEGQVYNISSYYDPKYKGMDPITCMQIQGYNLSYGYTQCTMVIENAVYALPIFNHMGRSYTNPVPCNCSTLTPEELSSPGFVCNIFSFLSGIVFFPTNDPAAVTRLLFKIGLEPVVVAGYHTFISEINDVAFPAMYIDSIFGQESPNNTLFKTPAYRADAYAFCNLTKDEFGNATSCAVVTFSLFDLYSATWTISEYYYQLTNGACSASFGPPRSVWNLLIETPFAPLTQDYQKCNYDSSTVVLNQAGSSVGNVSLLAPICIAFILLCVAYAQHLGFVTIKKTYTEAEKEAALSDLALKLLLARDRSANTQDSEKEDSLLNKLVEELARDPDAVYRTDSRADSQVSVDWDSLKSSLGLRRRPNGDSSAGNSPTVTSSSAAQSLHLAEEGRREGEASTEQRPVASPLHHFSDVADAVVAMRAGKNQFVVLNDYEVTPALLKLSGVEKAVAGSDSISTSTSTKDSRQLDIPALFVLLDRLVEAFETAGADKSRSVWAQVSQTAILRVVRVSSLSKKDSRALYYKLYTLLSFHAAAVLNVPVEEVKRTQGATVAYMIGLEILTLSAIHDKL